MDQVLLQWLNDVLQDQNVGRMMGGLFVLSVLAVVPLKSWKVLSIVVGLFGVIFALTPGDTAPFVWRFFGLVLIVLAPVMYIALARD